MNIILILIKILIGYVISINIFFKMFTIDHDREKNHSNLDIFKSILTPMIIIWIYIKYKYIMMIND